MAAGDRMLASSVSLSIAGFSAGKMIDILSVVVSAIQDIAQIAEELEEAGTQAARLARRLAELERPVEQMARSVKDGKDA